MASLIRSTQRQHILRPTTAATAAVGLVIGVLAGVLVAAPAAGAATNPAPTAGARKNATRLSFAISGTASLAVDVGTGNALFTDQLFTLPGVRADVPVTLWYNSSVWGSAVPSAVTGDTGSGWGFTGFDQRLVTNGDGSITYYGPGGLTGLFSPNGAGGFTAPPQFQADLVTISGGWTLTEHASQEKLTFNSAGRLTSDADRDGNATSYVYGPSYNPYPVSITSSRGSSGARTLTVTVANNQITEISQSSGYQSRSVSFGYSANGHLESVTDAAGGTTSFHSAYGTDTGQVITITNPAGNTSTFGFDSSNRVTSVAQANPPIDGGAGTSTTRLAYPSSSQTLVADPTTNQSDPVSQVPHTTYNLTSDQRVSSATDPDGNQRSATYTTIDNIASTTPASGGSTSFTYGSNSGESLTKIALPQGATDTAQYSNTGGSAYLPSSTTDDASNTLNYTYDSNGNQTGTQQGATGPTATVTYNSNGTAKTSASPGAPSGVVTSYGYDSTADLTSITPPSGTSLGSRSYTWDPFGRLATATDGKGDTITYSYDNLDRITKVHYSDGTPDVSYTYNPTGQITKRVDGSGTTTNTWDDLGHLLSTSNTANGLTVSYTYDLAGALKTAVDGAGTVTYGYDAAHLLTSMSYPQNGTTLTTWFANDSNGRRTDVWLQSNATHSVWAAHEHYSYDSSGRITGVLGQTGPATGPTTVVNETVCYAANSPAPSCSTATANDRSNIQWASDTVSGETNTYSYDTSGRLTKDVVTGGSNPRTYSYGYDQAGNRTSATVTGSSPSSQSLSFNAANQITSTGYSYDGAGNQTASPTRSASFNAAGQQTSATIAGKGTSNYTYAGTNENELLSQTVPGASTYTYSYGRPDKNGLPEIDAIKVGSGTGYVFHDPSGEPIMLQTNPQVTCLYLYDPMSNPIIIATGFNTTALALRYDPYGGATRTDSGGNNGASTENPFQFGEGVLDRATGELEFGQRWYSPVTGTWTQQDTLNAQLDPDNGNRYVYAADDPINKLDPTGRQGQSTCSEVDTSAACSVPAPVYGGGGSQDLGPAFDVFCAGTGAAALYPPTAVGTLYGPAEVCTAYGIYTAIEDFF